MRQVMNVFRSQTVDVGKIMVGVLQAKQTAHPCDYVECVHVAFLVFSNKWITGGVFNHDHNTIVYHHQYSGNLSAN